MCTVRASGTFCQHQCYHIPPNNVACTWIFTNLGYRWLDLRLDAHSSHVQYKVQICCSCMSLFCDVNFMYRLYHDCTRTLKRSLAGKLAIVKFSSGFGFARNSLRAPCALTSFSRARIPRSACTRDVTCELYCIVVIFLDFVQAKQMQIL